jgi:predicted short-subunit dehydrogenase-like oxidoreductase (DUF2520 family)
MFTKIAIIGTGNIGTWLFKTLQDKKDLLVISISGRKIETMPQDFDLYIFALKDDVYEEVLQQIPFQMPCAVHTSGSLSQNILAHYAEKFGVVYPYQTITRDEVMSRFDDEMIVEATLAVAPTTVAPTAVQKYAGAPICIEGSDADFEQMLFQWANTIFNTVYKINEKQRFAMHLAAVFANNFTNAMYDIAYQIFKQNDLDWLLVFPLLENTLEKAKQNEPKTVQTGPAVRGDISIMEKHCNALNDADFKTLYKLVSKIIYLKSMD